MRCQRCGERLEDGRHWCIPYANWVAQGMFVFVRGAIGTREGYRRSCEAPEAAVAGFSSCLAMSVAMVADISLKTLLAEEGRTPREFRSWGHDLRRLHGELSDGTKAKIEARYDSLGSPYREWRGEEGIEAIRRSFLSWRYLAEGHDGSLRSNPYRLAAVAYAVFSLHVAETDLPEIGSALRQVQGVAARASFSWRGTCSGRPATRARLPRWQRRPSKASGRALGIRPAMRRSSAHERFQTITPRCCARPKVVQTMRKARNHVAYRSASLLNRVSPRSDRRSDTNRTMRRENVANPRTVTRRVAM